jgi:two-component system phosphate regulon sensor histidine kinase PhoR
VNAACAIFSTNVSTNERREKRQQRGNYFFKQLLLNLLDNAIKYTEPRRRITLGLKIEKHNAVITVADTGRGIPAEDLPHIFERFYRRSGKTSDRSATGFGLGLSIVKWIVDAHGGKIEAESEMGSGTTFTVKLPLLDA